MAIQNPRSLPASLGFPSAGHIRQAARNSLSCSGILDEREISASPSRELQCFVSRVDAVLIHGLSAAA
jgi:hypothetical protein